MSARINGITNTNNDVNIENNMKVLPLVREEYYLTLEAFNKLELSKDISFVGNDVSFNANISVSGNIIPLGNTSQLGSNNKYWNNAYINNLHVNNFVNTINALYLTDNTITSAKIANNTITSAKIANNTIVDNNISLNAQILFSKINTTNAIMNSDISNNASIAFNKINTTNAIMNRDISANASIAFNKINTTNAIMDSDISSNASIAFSKINTTNAIMDSDISANASIAFSKINTTNAIMDTDISANANISGSKIAGASITSNKINSNETWSFLNIDVSFGNITDISVTNISISGNLIPLNNVVSDLGSSNNYWSNAYIHDISISNISVSTSINIPNSSILTKDISNLNITTDKIAEHAVTNFTIAQNAVGNRNIQDHAVTQAKIAHNTIQAININTSAPGTWTFRNISGTYMTISGNLIPLNNISSDLGTSSNYWRHAYIDNVDVSSHIRIGQGHFGGKILPTSTEHELIIDPHGYDFPYTGTDASGAVIILGDLIVRGNSTTITSSSIDISDLALHIASNATINTVYGTESGIELGSDKYATLLYNRVSNSWKTNIGLEISGAITLSGNLISSSNNSQLGSSNNYWSNAYIQDISVANISVTENFILNICGTTTNVNTRLSTIDSSFGIVNTRLGTIDSSLGIVNTRLSTIDSSFGIVNTRLTTIDSSFGIVNTRLGTIDSSFGIVNTRLSTIDSSLGIVNTRLSTIDSSFGIVNTRLGTIDSSLGIVNTRLGNIDTSFTTLLTLRDLSVNNNMSISGNLVPLAINNNSTLGSTTNYWQNAYINDISARNMSISGSISVSGNIVPLNNINSSDLGLSTSRWNNLFVRNIDMSGDISNVRDICNVRQIIPRRFSDISTSLGTSSNMWERAFINDLSGITRINGATWPLTSGGGGGTSDFSGLDINTNLIPRTPLSIDLGSSSKYWRNAYIQDISARNISISGNLTTDISNFRITTTHRVYQNICGDISWNGVNGYYGLAKDAYPSLNPLSSGDLAVSNLTTRDIGTTGAAAWNAICWSPELRIFVVGSYIGIGIMTSTNGINWTTSSVASGESKGTICWSPELRLFVAVYWNGYAMTSNNGINWNQGTTFGTSAWYGACWAPQLGIFVAVGLVGTNNRVMTSRNGLAWTRGTNIPQSDWISVVWSPELGIFVAVSAGSTANFAMTSSDGINWTMLTNALFNYSWKGLCWSPQLGIFVSIANSGRVMTSNNGINWNIYTSGPPNGSETSLSWSPQLGLFFSTSNSGTIATSSNGINWTTRTSTGTGYRCSCWSPELGIFVSPSTNGYVLTSSLKGRPPTSYNVFDSSFNRIDESGNWTFSNISVSGNILSTNNNSQVPVSYNTFSVVSAQTRGSLPSYIGTTSANVWLPASAYDISKVVLSNRSFIKIEVKVNYTASPEADQTLSFRVLESFNRGISFETNPVFSDISLGSSMGVTINNIYNGSYYEDLSGVTLSGNIITYRLEFRRDCPVDNTIKTGYGIQQSTGNYMSLQELYRP
jgi:hypothetical protein